MKKIFLMLFLCVFFTSCGRENETKQTNYMQNKTQENLTNKDIKFSIEDKVYTQKNQNGKWDIHYPKLEGKKVESCNMIILAHIKKMMSEIDIEQEVDTTLNYEIKTETDTVLSILFTGNYNVKETAHPMNISFSVNYDWEKNRELLLTDIIAESESFVLKCKKAVSQQCEKEFQDAFSKLSDEQIKEQIFEEEDQFYLEDEKINIRLVIPAGAYYYQYVSCDIQDK